MWVEYELKLMHFTAKNKTKIVFRGFPHFVKSILSQFHRKTGKP